ncbi:hypothetical protein [Oryza sativa Japonica Group]|uniref:Uncharacterized protein n=1 Tax=Oryza sativa subsp. japonica TaxID=39947 RepID=Q9FPB0_ORYSJ|nr:hypothetical protein [Oryza sativa Japonica Group]
MPSSTADLAPLYGLHTVGERSCIPDLEVEIAGVEVERQRIWQDWVVVVAAGHRREEEGDGPTGRRREMDPPAVPCAAPPPLRPLRHPHRSSDRAAPLPSRSSDCAAPPLHTYKGNARVSNHQCCRIGERTGEREIWLAEHRLLKGNNRGKSTEEPACCT